MGLFYDRANRRMRTLDSGYLLYFFFFHWFVATWKNLKYMKGDRPHASDLICKSVKGLGKRSIKKVHLHVFIQILKATRPSSCFRLCININVVNWNQSHIVLSSCTFMCVYNKCDGCMFGERKNGWLGNSVSTVFTWK